MVEEFTVLGSNPPKPYMSAMSLLEKVRAQKGNVNEAISGAVSWAMDDARKWLTTIPAKAVASEKAMPIAMSYCVRDLLAP